MTLSPARLAELTRLAADIVRSVDEDRVMPHGLVLHSNRALGYAFLASDVESLLLELAQVITALSAARDEACQIAETLSSYVPKFPAEGGPTMTDKRIAELRRIGGGK